QGDLEDVILYGLGVVGESVERHRADAVPAENAQIQAIDKGVEPKHRKEGGRGQEPEVGAEPSQLNPALLYPSSVGDRGRLPRRHVVRTAVFVLVPARHQLIERCLDVLGSVQPSLLAAHTGLEIFLKGAGDLGRPIPVKVDREVLDHAGQLTGYR